VKEKIMSTRPAPSADVFARTIPLKIERHAFGEHRKASLVPVEIHKTNPDDPEPDKRLLALSKRRIQMEETNAIRHCDVQFRQYLETVATPFADGLWLVPVGMVERVHARARAWEQERSELADAAALAYPGQLEAMRAPLGPLFSLFDYPPVDQFRASFWVEWRFVDLGVPNVLREISVETFERERVKMQEAGDRARQMIEQHLAGSLLQITDHLAELLKPKANGRRSAVRDGTLDDLFQFLDTVALRDVTNFAQLREVTERLRATAAGLDVEQLRSDDTLRARTADAMTEARAAVSALVTEETRRAIRVRDDDENAA
jgi:hypothetical protein